MDYLKYFIKKFIYFFVSKKMLIGIILILLCLLFSKSVFAVSDTTTLEMCDLSNPTSSSNFVPSYNMTFTNTFPQAVLNKINLDNREYILMHKNNGSLFQTRLLILGKDTKAFFDFTNKRFYFNGSYEYYSYDNSSIANTYDLSNLTYTKELSGGNFIIGNSCKAYICCDVWALDSSGGDAGTYIYDYHSVITNTIDDLVNLSSNIVIHAGYDIRNTQADFLISSISGETTEILFRDTLNSSSEYYHFAGDLTYFEFPVDVIKPLLISGQEYSFSIMYKPLLPGLLSVDNSIDIVYGQGVVDEEKNEVLNKIDNLVTIIGGQTDAINKQTEQQHEDNKGIIETIKQVISFINPLSENFFVYKLMDLLLDLLIKVFVPSGEFFSEWFADLNEYFGDRFGMLYYPFELIIDILNRVKNLTANLNGNFVLKTPNLDIFGSTLIPAYEFNFNEFLQNDTFKTVYNVYLTSVDVILICCLVILCKNTFVEVFGGRFVDDVVDTVQSRGGNKK